MSRKPVASMPRDIARRIMRRARKGGPLVVTVDRNGKPSRVYGYERYQKMKSLPASVKPWEHRKSAQPTPDPLGAIRGMVRKPLTRSEIYSE